MTIVFCVALVGLGGKYVGPVDEITLFVTVLDVVFWVVGSGKGLSGVGYKYPFSSKSCTSNRN